MKKPTPLAILSDSPEAPSGFGRIVRDLCWRLYREVPQVRIATFGYWGIGSSKFPWPQYQLGQFREDVNLSDLPLVWNDFAQGQEGILLTIYDPARLTLLSCPQYLRPTSFVEARLKSFLEKRPFKLWGYFPIDSHCPGGGLTSVLAETVRGFDRALAYGPYGQTVLNRCGVQCAWLPHGIDLQTFQPRGREARQILQREGASITQDDKLLGVVATNQPRKDWGTVFETLMLLGPEWKLWAHTDKTIGAWSFPALAEAFGIERNLFVTQGLDDEELSRLYSACNVTFAPGLGEGYGYPIVESMACGVPVVHVDFAGGADLVPQLAKIPPSAYRLEGAYTFLRPVLAPEIVAKQIQVHTSGEHLIDWQGHADQYSWPELWPKWKSWFRDGL